MKKGDKPPAVVLVKHDLKTTCLFLSTVWFQHVVKKQNPLKLVDSSLKCVRSTNKSLTSSFRYCHTASPAGFLHREGWSNCCVAAQKLAPFSSAAQAPSVSYRQNSAREATSTNWGARGVTTQEDTIVNCLVFTRHVAGFIYNLQHDLRLADLSTCKRIK